METEVPDEIESLLDELTTFQDAVQTDTTIRQILQLMGTLLRNGRFRSLHLNHCKIFLGELMSLCRPTYDLPGGPYDLLNRGRLFLRCYERFFYYLIFGSFNFPSPAIHDTKLAVHKQLADIESKILEILDCHVNGSYIYTLDAETIQRVTHRPWTDQIVAGRQKLEADFNSYMESISPYMESILFNSASSRALLYRVWDFHQGDISAASRAPVYRVWDSHQGDISAVRRALFSELAAHLGSHAMLHSQLHPVPSTHPGNHSQLHPVPSTHPGNHSQLHLLPSTHPGNHSQLHLLPSTHSGSHAMLDSQLHPVPSTHPGNLSQLHLVPSTHSGCHAMPDSQLHPVPSTHPGNHSQLHLVPSNHSGSHVTLDLFQDPTGVEEQPLVNRPRLPETFLGITSQAALAMLTISVSGRTSFSQNANILFWSAAACNLIGFLFCLFSILLSGRRTGVAPRIVTGTGFVFTAYGFLAIMGMLLSDNIMLWITGLACIASFPALASAFMK